MKFAQWFAEMDQQQSLPDPRQFSYLACVLDLTSQGELEAMAEKWALEKMAHGISPNWRWRSHHMTVLPPRSGGGLLIQDLEAYKPFFGEMVRLHVTGIAANDKVIAVTVRPDPANFKIVPAVPHITVAHSNEVRPFVSNNLLMDRSKIYQFEGAELRSTFFAVGPEKAGSQVWPAPKVAVAKP